MRSVGILGGGQLAQMLLQAAISLGVEVVIFEQSANSPASYYSRHNLSGRWDDLSLLRRFADLAEVITLENEFVPPSVLEQLEAWGKPVFPTSATLQAIQDKWQQKQTFQAAGIPLAQSQAVDDLDQARHIAYSWGYPVVLKARRNGYDGYGNATIHTPAEWKPAWERLAKNGCELLVEAFIPFEQELAVMVVRGQDGTMQTYPVVETIQKNHICHLVCAPAPISNSQQHLAQSIAQQAVQTIQGVGIFGVELFALADGQVLLNEIAPRPHNSGHYTMEACYTSQFENHLRAILGWSLGSTALRTPAAVMVNLLGERNGAVNPNGLAEALTVENAHVHLYGKQEVRLGRKMGHITALGETLTEAEQIAQTAAQKMNL